MIVIDSSALCAVFFEEPDRRAFVAIMDGTDRCVISAVNVHEMAAVLRGKLGDPAVDEFWQWLADNRVEVVGPLTDVEAPQERITRSRRKIGSIARAASQAWLAPGWSRRLEGGLVPPGPGGATADAPVTGRENAALRDD